MGKSCFQRPKKTKTFEQGGKLKTGGGRHPHTWPKLGTGSRPREISDRSDPYICLSHCRCPAVPTQPNIFQRAYLRCLQCTPHPASRSLSLCSDRFSVVHASSAVIELFNCLSRNCRGNLFSHFFLLFIALIIIKSPKLLMIWGKVGAYIRQSTMLRWRPAAVQS